MHFIDGGITTSPWEDVLLSFDLVVVGAGIIGLSTAIDIAERYPTRRIVILERGLLPTGATTRNAGFACFGSAGEIYSDIARMGQKGAMAVVERRIEGLRKLKQRCSEADIGLEEHGGHELFFADHEVLSNLPELNEMLEPLLGEDVFTRRDDLITKYRFGPSTHALVYIKHEATLHSGLLVNALWRKAQQLGVRILTGALVTHIHNGQSLTVHTIGGERTIQTDTTVLATNGNLSQITVTQDALTLKLPSFEPARGQVMLTSPIEGLTLRGSFHFDSGYYYFRNVGNRILFGGGRNSDFDAERTFSMKTTEPLQEHLEQLLRTVIAPGRDVHIERRWSGTMAFTADRQPLVEKVAKNVVLAFGCNGMGIALASNIAADVAECI